MKTWKKEKSMLYLNEKNIRDIGIRWDAVINVIKDTCLTLHAGDYAQPVKPYLRYREKRNRIIAMPAFVGGNSNIAGIKWIASFPGNISNNIPRAHAVTVLNNADTGIPEGIINTPMISTIRTAAVSGLIMQLWLASRPQKKRKIGMTGYGPIGQLHTEMLFHLLGESLEQLDIYDAREIDPEVIPPQYKDRIRICSSWQEAFEGKDIFLTCTVADKPYIDLPPVKGSLHLNVSLRDYTSSWREFADVIIVDDWKEVCRENTDIEMMHLHNGLQENEVLTIPDVVSNNRFNTTGDTQTIMFNPMGMSVFDIAVGKYYLHTATVKEVGTLL